VIYDEGLGNLFVARVVAPIVPIIEEMANAGTPADELLAVVTKENVRRAVQALTSNSLLADLIAQDKLAIVGREYLLESGRARPV
jgi:carbonic anhydrase